MYVSICMSSTIYLSITSPERNWFSIGAAESNLDLLQIHHFNWQPYSPIWALYITAASGPCSISVPQALSLSELLNSTRSCYQFLRARHRTIDYFSFRRYKFASNFCTSTWCNRLGVVWLWSIWSDWLQNVVNRWVWWMGLVDWINGCRLQKNWHSNVVVQWYCLTTNIIIVVEASWKFKPLDSKPMTCF